MLKHGIAYYFGAVPTYSMVYGAFAALPIFLVWIYISAGSSCCWAPSIAAYAPLVGKQMTRLDDVPGTEF